MPTEKSISLDRRPRVKAAIPAGLLAAVMLAAAVFAALTGCAEAAAPCAADPYSALRLHIIADSDSAAAQEAKLAVRDAVLACVRERFARVSTRDEAEEALKALGSEIEAAARAVLISRGMDDNVQLMLGDFDFPDREYGGIVYPAGRYRALRLLIGSGGGRNWWCVMFPPLCIINDAEPEMNGNGTLEFRSFFADLWQKLFG